MAKKKDSVVVDPEPLEEDEADPVRDADDEDISSVISQLPESDAYCQVWRLHDDGKKSLRGRVSAIGFNLEEMQKKLGAGRFVFDFYAPCQSGPAKGQMRRAARRTVYFDAPLDGAVSSPLSPPAAAAAPSDLAEFMRALAAQQSQSLREIAEMMRAVLAPRAEKPLDIVELQRGLLENLQTLQGMTPGSALPGAPGRSSISQVREFLEVAKTLQGVGEQPPWVPIVERAIEVLSPALQAFGERMGAAPPAAPRLAAPVPHRSSGAPPAGAGAPASASVSPSAAVSPASDLTVAVSQLCMAAAAGIDPARVVDEVLDATSPRQLRALLDGDPIPKLAQFDPRVKNSEQWFRRLESLLREAIADEAEPDGVTDAPAHGDTVGVTGK